MKFKWDQQTKLGTALATTGVIFPIPGILLYAMVSSFIGEERLEAAGRLTTTGGIVLYLPAIIGLLLIIDAQFFKPDRIPRKINGNVVSWVAILLGIAMISTAMTNIAEASETRDPQIGSGLLLIAGFAITLYVALMHLGKSFRQKGREEVKNDKKRTTRKTKKTSSKK